MDEMNEIQMPFSQCEASSQITITDELCCGLLAGKWKLIGVSDDGGWCRYARIPKAKPTLEQRINQIAEEAIQKIREITKGKE